MKIRMESSVRGKTAALASVGILALYAVLPAIADTISVGGITWTYTEKDDDAKTITLGGGGSSLSSYTPAIPTSTSLDAANIPWKIEIGNETYTVRKIAAYAFYNCANLTGTLAIPYSVTNIGERCFSNCSGLTRLASLGGVQGLGAYAFASCSSLAGDISDLTMVKTFGNGAFQTCPKLVGEVRLNPALAAIVPRLFNGTAITKVTIPRSVQSVGDYSFCNVKFGAVVIPGPKTVTSGSQAYITITDDNPFNGVNNLTALFGWNTKVNKKAGSAGNMLRNASNCTLLMPANGFCDDFNLGGTNNRVVYYGPTNALDIAIDDSARTIKATPTTENSLSKMINMAAALGKCGWEIRVNVTNSFEVTSGTITPEMLTGGRLEFLRLGLVFPAASQSQFNSALASVSSEDDTIESEQIMCDGVYPWHPQGVATDGNSIFWSFTTVVVKTDLVGKVLDKYEITRDEGHIGDMCCQDGKLYAGVSDGRNEVWMFSTDKLKLLKKFPTSEAVWGNGGIGYYGGSFWVIGNAPHYSRYNMVFRYSPDFKFRGCRMIDSGWTHLGVQTACRYGDKMLFGCWGRPNDARLPHNPCTLVVDGKALMSLKMKGEYSEIVACERRVESNTHQGMLVLGGRLMSVEGVRLPSLPKTNGQRWRARLIPFRL